MPLPVGEVPIPRLAELAVSGHTNLSNASNSPFFTRKPGPGSSAGQRVPLPLSGPSEKQPARDTPSVVKFSVPDHDRSVSGTNANMLRTPIPNTFQFPDGSGVPGGQVNTGAGRSAGVPGEKIFVDPQLPPMPPARRAVTVTLLEHFRVEPVATNQTNQFTDKTAAPLAVRFPAADNAPVDDPKPAAVMVVDPLLENVDEAAQRREGQLTRQEAERKARETKRDTLNRAFYKFLLGKQAATNEN